MTSDSITINIEGTNNDSKIILDSAHSVIGSGVVRELPSLSDNISLSPLAINDNPPLFEGLGGNVSIIGLIPENVLADLFSIGIGEGGSATLLAERSMPGFIAGCENFCVSLDISADGTYARDASQNRLCTVVACPAIWQSKHAGKQWSDAAGPLFQAAAGALAAGEQTFEIPTNLNVESYIVDKPKFIRHMLKQAESLNYFAGAKGVNGEIIAGADDLRMKIVLDPSSISPPPDGLDNVSKEKLWYGINDVITTQRFRVDKGPSCEEIITHLAKQIIANPPNAEGKWFLSHNPNVLDLNFTTFKQEPQNQEEVCLMQWDASAQYSLLFNNIHASYYLANDAGPVKKLEPNQCMTVPMDVCMTTFDFSGVTQLPDGDLQGTIGYLQNMSYTVTETTTANDLSGYTDTSYHLLKMVLTEAGKSASQTEFMTAKDTSNLIVDVSGVIGSYNHETYGAILGEKEILRGSYLLPSKNEPNMVAGFAWLLHATLAEAANIGINDSVVQAGYRSVEVRSIAQTIADNDVVYKLEMQY